MFFDCCLFSGVYVERAEAAFWFLSLFLFETVGRRECPDPPVSVSLTNIGVMSMRYQA